MIGRHESSRSPVLARPAADDLLEVVRQREQLPLRIDVASAASREATHDGIEFSLHSLDRLTQTPGRGGDGPSRFVSGNTWIPNSTSGSLLCIKPLRR